MESLNHYALVAADLRVELSDLELEAEGLQDKIDQLKNAISFIEGRMSDARMEDEPAPAGPYEKLSLTEAAAKHLSIVGRSSSTREIANALAKGGYPTEAKNPYNNVYGTLNRESEKPSPRVVKVGSKWDLPTRVVVRRGL